MVSTRGVRYKFTEGERVLCYEPDPTKAKVLYDSKVLEVVENKDKRGRRTVEYLIHFQGWNSSWDRCVSEDFVLKDTEENRQLQRDLAEKSQLQLGAYLYRRERKKGVTSGSSSGGGPSKRARHGLDDDASSNSTHPDDGEPEDTDTSSGSMSGLSTPHAPTSPPPRSKSRSHIELPPELRDRLTMDFHLVRKCGRLSRLPASPPVVEILEGYVLWFVRTGAWQTPQSARGQPPLRPDLWNVSCRLNLVREVVEGIRTYFDFYLRGHLLYKSELAQYNYYCGTFNDRYVKPSMRNPPESNGVRKDVKVDADNPNEYAHLPPDPVVAVTEQSTSAPTTEDDDDEASDSSGSGETNDEGPFEEKIDEASRESDKLPEEKSAHTKKSTDIPSKDNNSKRGRNTDDPLKESFANRGKRTDRSPKDDSVESNKQTNTPLKEDSSQTGEKIEQPKEETSKLDKRSITPTAEGSDKKNDRPFKEESYTNNNRMETAEEDNVDVDIIKYSTVEGGVSKTEKSGEDSSTKIATSEERSKKRSERLKDENGDNGLKIEESRPAMRRSVTRKSDRSHLLPSGRLRSRKSSAPETEKTSGCAAKAEPKPLGTPSTRSRSHKSSEQEDTPACVAKMESPALETPSASTRLRSQRTSEKDEDTQAEPKPVETSSSGLHSSRSTEKDEAVYSNSHRKTEHRSSRLRSRKSSEKDLSPLELLRTALGCFESPSTRLRQQKLSEKEATPACNVKTECQALQISAARTSSQKSSTSESEREMLPASVLKMETPSTSGDSSGSSSYDSWAARLPRPVAPAAAGPVTPPSPAPGATAPSPSTLMARTPLSQLFLKVAHWRLVSRENTEHLPCRVYGAIHLARLFVKLPGFLNATRMPDNKLKIVLKHIDMFLQYLNDHTEWFGESYYTAAPGESGELQPE